MTISLSIVMMQKDEGALLRAWIDHHARITNTKNIFVFDNGSTCPITKKHLRRAKEKGVNVSYEFNNPEDFEKKGIIVGNLIRTIQENSSSTFIIPLDCDEFLASGQDNSLNIEFNHEAVRTSLKDCVGKEGFFRLKRHYFNDTSDKDLYHIANSPDKFFFGSAPLKQLDVGFHQPKMKHGDHQLHLESKLIAFHYHNKRFSTRRANAINKMRSRVPAFLPNNLKIYRGAGLHLIKDLSGIDEQFAPPEKQTISAFHQHIKKENIKFPYHLFSNQSTKDVQAKYINTARASRNRQRYWKILNRLSIKILKKTSKVFPKLFETPHAISNIQTAKNEIQKKYQIKQHQKQYLERYIKNQQEKIHQPQLSRPIIHLVENEQELANAYLSTLIWTKNQKIIFVCYGFWESVNIQLLTLTSSAVHADNNIVVLRNESIKKNNLRLILLIHFLALSGSGKDQENSRSQKRSTTK